MSDYLNNYYNIIVVKIRYYNIYLKIVYTIVNVTRKLRCNIHESVTYVRCF